MRHYLQRRPDVSIYKFLFYEFYFLSRKRISPYLEEMDKSTIQLKHRLRQRTTKKDLLGISDIEKGMVYFVSVSNKTSFFLEQTLKVKLFISN